MTLVLPASDRPSHLPALDGLRGVAILLVIATHTASGLFGALSIYEDPADRGHSLQLSPWLDAVASYGYHGVTLFFVVSAFTLTRQMRGAGPYDLRRYALRRIFRVGPGYWLAGLAYFTLLGNSARDGVPAGYTGLDLLSGFTFTGLFVSPAAVSIVPGGWSVQVEVAFYALLPLVLWVTRRRAVFMAGLTITAIIAAQVVMRHAALAGFWSYPLYTTPPIQLPVFLAGMTAGLLRPERWRTGRAEALVPAAAVALLAAAILVVPFSPLAGWRMLLHVQFAMLAAGATLLAAWHPPRLLTSAALTSIGTVSYSMYLIHFVLLWPFYAAMHRLLPAGGALAFGLTFAAVTASAYVLARFSYRWIEQPPRRWIAARLAAQRAAMVPVLP